MIYALIILQVLDAVSTYLCLTKGVGVEGNTWLARLFARVGMVEGLLMTKGALIGLLLLFGHMVHDYALALLILFYVYIIFNNFKVLRGR
jgi:Domain of unknown function (DUF5658)